MAGDEIDAPARLELIVRGAGRYDRVTCVEPSLLPELARRCGPEAVGGIIAAADSLGREGAHPHAWPQIREATMLVLLRRFGRDDVLGWSRGETDPDEVDTWRIVLGQSPGEPLRERLEAGSDWRAPQLLARIIASGGDPEDILRFVTDHPGRDLDACAVRSLAEAAKRADIRLPIEWLDAAVGDDDWLSIGRAAHLLVVLPNAERRQELAARIIAELHGAPPWLVALTASAIAHDAPDEAVAELLVGDPYPKIWTGLIRELFAGEHSATADDDLERAHPFHAELAALDGEGVAEELPYAILDSWGGSMSMAGPEPEPHEPRAPREPVDDRRLGVDVVAGGNRIERALIRDTLTELTVSIGPPGSARVQLERPADIDFGDADRLTLPVTLYDDEGLQTQELRIWRDPGTRADVTFDVIPRSDRYHATIVVYHADGSTVVQAAAFAARVVGDAATEAASERTYQLIEVAAGAVGGGAHDRVGSVVADDRRALFASPGVPIHALPTGAVQGVAPLMAMFRTAASNFVHTGGAFDITPALVTAARLGFRLRRALQLEPLGGMDRIQVVPLSPAAIFPLELVYDGAPPDADATTCTDWTDAGTSGRCPSCTDAEDTRTVCPLRFWGLTKVIEHHYPERTPRDPTVAGAPFVARVQFGAERQLEMPTHAVIGVSDEVALALGVRIDDATPVTERVDRIESLAAALHEVIDAVADFGQCEVAADWTEWRDAVQRSAPGLLIAMPHQGGDSLTEPSLELGGIAETTLLERDVRPPGSRPGPVVLLLGCDTSNAPDLLASFASDARHYAPVVVATIGRVVAAEAPHVAAKVVEQLVAGRTGRAEIGTALIEARRALLAEGRLVGLQLIAHGDARWNVPARH